MIWWVWCLVVCSDDGFLMRVSLVIIVLIVLVCMGVVVVWLRYIVGLFVIG